MDEDAPFIRVPSHDYDYEVERFIQQRLEQTLMESHETRMSHRVRANEQKEKFVNAALISLNTPTMLMADSSL